MSDQNNDNETQPLETEPMKQQSMRKTSSVPLRKETVRVTLKSTPAGAKQPPETSGPPAPKAMSPHTGPQTVSAPSTHNPNIPDVTSAVPLKEETMRVTLKADSKDKAEKPAPPAPKAPSAPKAPTPAASAPKAPAPAPTVPLNVGAGAKAPASAPKTPAPAPTVPLNLGAGAKAPVALATQPLGNASQPLPKATVQLEQTQQLGTPSAVGTPDEQTPTIQTVVDEESSEERSSNVVTYLAVAAFVLSLFCLFAQFKQAKVWMDEEGSSIGAIFS
ncbi:hypothetical protein ACFPK9_05480 [Rubritalea spongiae]|uniref:Uncharacterized protein n=1 Tax=Rubritalea spongiae TaxID=430797 RepID=A0ABW5E4X8_9BACT